MDDLSKYYQTLGLEAGSSPDQVKQAYRDLVKVWHPDRFAHDERLRLIAQEKLKEINSAYDSLTTGLAGGGIAPNGANAPESETTPFDKPSPDEQDAPARATGKHLIWWVIVSVFVLALIVAWFMFLRKKTDKNLRAVVESKPLPAASNPDVAVATNPPVPIATGSSRSGPNVLVDKTLVAWVTVANLTQRAGTVISICDYDSLHYDSLDLGQVVPRKWDVGSDWWARGNYSHDFPDETADPDTVIQLVVTYRDHEITLYREGRRLLQYTTGSPPQLFEPKSLVMFGMRNPREHERFAGTIQEARIYYQALTLEQITALKTNEASNPAPWAWWNFADGTPRDHTGRFGASRFVGGAKIENGRLVLDGTKGILYAARTPEELEAALPTPVPGHCALSLNCGFPGLAGNTNTAVIVPTGSLTGTFTVECWALTKQTSPGQAMIGSRKPKDFGFDLKFDPARIHADIGNGSDWITTKVDAPFKHLTDKWYHIACVVTRARCGIYINGVLCGYKEYPSDNPLLYDADHPLYIGSIDGQSEFLAGHISELRIWQTARTQPEIRANMNRKLLGTEPGLRGYWRFDEGSGTLAADRTGHGFNGTLLADAEWTTNAPPLLGQGK